MRFFATCLLAAAVFLSGISPALCASSPEEAVRSLAETLRRKDVKAFSRIVDVGALFDVSFAKGYDGGEQVGFMPFRQSSIDEVLDQVASGVYARECAEASRPGCPWYPDGLAKADISRSDDSSALVSVDSKKDIRTWLVLHKTGGEWKVVAAPKRFKDAELFATDSFRRTLASYRDALARMFKKEAEQQAAYERGAAHAAAKAAKILDAVTISNIRVTVGEGTDGRGARVTCTAKNGYSEELRLWTVEFTITDAGGKVVETKQFKDSTPYIQPGGSAQMSFTTSTRTEAEYDFYRRLAQGTYRIKGRSIYLLVGKRNLHIDETGGGLKPRR